MKELFSARETLPAWLNMHDVVPENLVLLQI
jgi:hypothetical protein